MPAKSLPHGLTTSNLPAPFVLTEILAVHDHKDPTSVQTRTRQRASKVSDQVLRRMSNRDMGSLEGLRIGIPQECFPAEINSQVLPTFNKVVQSLSLRGATVVPVHLPNIALALSAYYVITTAEASSNLARFDGVRYGFRYQEEAHGRHEARDSGGTTRRHPYALTRSMGFGREVQKRLLLGSHALSADGFSNTFLRAQSIRKVIQQDFDNVFRIENVLKRMGDEGGDSLVDEDSAATGAAPRHCVDVLLHPCSVNTAPTLYEAKYESSVDEYVQDLLTVPSSLAGLPAVSMPLGFAEDGWPVGTMAVTQWGMEDLLAVVARATRQV